MSEPKHIPDSSGNIEKNTKEKVLSASAQKSIWNTWLRPVVVLVIICFIASSLLVLTNTITSPIIAENALATENAIRKELLPVATSFEDITPAPLPDNIASVYKANDDLGYVIGAYSQGYGGKVPVLVGIDNTGTITGVHFLANDETPGLGQKIVSDTSFAKQFIGMKADVQVDANASATTDATATATTDTATATATPSADSAVNETTTSVIPEETITENTSKDTQVSSVAETATATATATEATPQEIEIQAIATATISSDAATNAVKYALDYYAISIMGSTINYDITEPILQELAPGSTSWQRLDITATDVASAYVADTGVYIIVTQGKSQNTIYAAVAFDENGTITALWLDTSQESPNYGQEIDENEEYIAQYIGKNNTDTIQGIAGVTNSSRGVKAAVDAALAAFPIVKEAA